MSGPRLVFAGSPAEAPPPDGATTCVILDTTWTPAPGERADLLPLRRLAGDALRAADLFEEALDRLDRWAAEARLADLLEVGDTTYWYRLREVAWHWLLERLIWERVIRAARGPATPASLAAPGEEVALLEVAAAVGRATGAEVRPFPGRAGPGYSLTVKAISCRTCSFCSISTFHEPTRRVTIDEVRQFVEVPILVSRRKYSSSWNSQRNTRVCSAPELATAMKQ